MWVCMSCTWICVVVGDLLTFWVTFGLRVFGIWLLHFVLVVLVD